MGIWGNSAYQIKKQFEEYDAKEKLGLLPSQLETTLNKDMSKIKWTKTFYDKE